jgi:predicted short-subunit dehydrogenase-like oxidoreductase (DUF2520 family)
MPSRAVPKPRIAIVGAGNLAAALAARLSGANYTIDEVVSRSLPKSFRRASQLARALHAIPVTCSKAKLRAEIVWFCVPDGEIANAANSLAERVNWNGKLAFHSSGALASHELRALQQRGAEVASVHPFMTFVRASRPSLEGVPFALEGDARAVRAARRIVKDLGGEAYSIRAQDKAAYHAWGTFASPLFVALLTASEHVASHIGVRPQAARKRMLPILKQTLKNYEAFGAAGAFSGPIPRGDVATIERHLRVLQKIPGAREIYVALVRSALRDLPARDRRALRRILPH